MEVELMVTKRDDNRRRPTDRVNIEQSASGRWKGRVLQLSHRQQGDSLHRQSLPRPQGLDGSPKGKWIYMGCIYVR